MVRSCTDAPYYSHTGVRPASVVESVDTATLKVAAYGRAGSSPAGGTTASLYKPSPPILDTSASHQHTFALPLPEGGHWSCICPRVKESS